MPTYHGIRMSCAAADAARLMDDLRIPWTYGPEKDVRPDFLLWPMGKHPYWLETKSGTGSGADIPGDISVTIMKLGTLRTARPDAVLLLWLVQPERPDKGHLLVNVPGGDWVRRAATEFLQNVSGVLNPPRSVSVQPSWWRRFCGKWFS